MTQEKSNWLTRLKTGLFKTSSQISEGITGIFTRRKLDANMLEELEEVLIMADIGAPLARKLVQDFGKNRFDKEIAPEEVKTALAEQIAVLLRPVALPFVVDASKKPMIVLVVGVNGNGKTTTIGKLSALLQENGHKVMLAACDTFRAAAVEQLQRWGERAGVPVIRSHEGADPASVAFQAVEQAKQQGMDVVLIDTAGRLHNQQNLMQELEKISRVIKKIDDSAPHAVLQILDGTTGQNAMTQVEAFKKLVNVSGLVVTKLDGTARGGIVLALAEKFKLPIHAVGVGESMEDLRPFVAEEFAKSLLG